MTKLGPYEVHPAADLFSLVQGEEFDELTADIKRDGLSHPIILNHDRTVLIDGRNRYRACVAAGVEPSYKTLSADYTETMVLDLIVRENSLRRQMSVGEKGMIAVELKPMYDAAVEAERAAQQSEKVSKFPGRIEETGRGLDPGHDLSGKPNSNNRRAATRAGAAVGASRDAVNRSQFVKNYTPDLAEKVRRNEIALDAAYKQARQHERSMPKPEPAPKPTAVMLTLRTSTGDAVAYREPKAKTEFNQTRGDGISWARWSWNPVTGCLHGCTYCYARAFATNERFKDGFPAGFTPLFHHQRLDAPANTTIPVEHQDEPSPCEPDGCPWRRVFVCSMADLYGRWVPDEWIDQVHASMLASPQWEYLLLTKFPARYVGLDLPPEAWVGTSVDEQKRVRIAEDAFRQLDGVRVKWLSLEPLREPLEFTDLTMFDWVVIGAQTETYQPDGPVPAFKPPFDWVDRIYRQAREAGCRVHMKPNLVNGKPGMQLPDEYPPPT